MKLTIVNTSGKNLSLPGPLAAFATGGGLAAGASITGTLTQAELDRCDTELALLKSKGYLTYLVALDATVDDSLEGVVQGQVQTAVLTLTNAQLKALKATPVTLVAAPGAGKVIVPVECTCYFKYGSNAFTGPTAAEILTVKRVGGASLLIGGHTTLLLGTASGSSKMALAGAAQASIADSKTLSDNIALQIANIGSAELAGNAGGDNLVTVVLSYRVDLAGW